MLKKRNKELERLVSRDFRESEQEELADDKIEFAREEPLDCNRKETGATEADVRV